MITREEIYEKIEKYPLPDHTITYKPYIRGIVQKRTNFEDLIHLNLNEIVPNVYLGIYKGHSNMEIEDWAEKCKEYGNKLNEEFQKQCNKKIEQIRQIEEQKIRSNKLELEKVKELPEEVQSNIQSFLVPETRLQLLELKHKNIRKEMKKWKVDQLKNFLKNVICDVYEPRSSENYMKQCLPARVTIYKSCTNKEQYIIEIFKLFDHFKKAVPKDYDKYHYFWKNALYMFMSILYVHKRVVKTDPPNDKEEGKKKRKVMKIKKKVNNENQQ